MLNGQAVPRATASKVDPRFPPREPAGGTAMVTLNINGKPHKVDASPDTPLLWVLRDWLGLTGTKFGCGVALCGACTVHLDGIPRRACVMPVSAAVGHSITTIEATGALLAKIPKPTDTDIDQAMSGNICRCGTYTRIREAIKHAAMLPAH